MAINRKIINDCLLLLAVMLAGGLLSVELGKEMGWDLAQYHFYSPFSFLHNRQSIDFWPSNYIHQYINPTLDLLTYFLINNFSPFMAVFILGALHGANVWLLFLIARQFLHEPVQLGIALFLAVISIYAPVILPGMGSFQNDNLISLYILSFVLLQLMAVNKYALTNQVPFSLLMASGFLLGLGFGLKLTAGVFVVGATLTLLFLPIPFRDRLKFLFIWGSFTFLGLLLTAGHWMLTMWEQHHNPFFPFFNSIFKSPDFMAVDWRDTRFLPHGLLQTLFYPFYFAWDGRVTDAPCRDFRLLIIYLLFVLLAMQWFWKKSQHQAIAASSLSLTWLFSFFIFSYMIWQYYFSIARYIAALELLSPLIIYFLILKLFKSNLTRYSVLFVIVYLLLFSMIPVHPMVRMPWYGSTYFNITMPEIVKQTPTATVLMAYPAYVKDANPRPQRYLIPYFPKGWRFIGIPFFSEKYLFDAKTENVLLAQIYKDKNKNTDKNKDKNKIYLLAASDSIMELFKAAEKFNLIPDGECEKIFSDRKIFIGQDTLLCPVRTHHI